MGSCHLQLSPDEPNEDIEGQKIEKRTAYDVDDIQRDVRAADLLGEGNLAGQAFHGDLAVAHRIADIPDSLAQVVIRGVGVRLAIRLDGGCGRKTGQPYVVADADALGAVLIGLLRIVGDHTALEAPLVAEHLRQQAAVRAGSCGSDAVEGGYHGRSPGLLPVISKGCR